MQRKYRVENFGTGFIFGLRLKDYNGIRVSCPIGLSLELKNLMIEYFNHKIIKEIKNTNGKYSILVKCRKQESENFFNIITENFYVEQVRKLGRVFS